MIKNKRIVGVCVAELHDNTRRVIIDNLYKEFRGTDYKLIVFNSLLDLYNGDSYDEGSAAVFNLINYKIMDAIIILDQSFRKSGKVNSLITKAQENRVPVILIKAEKDGCFCIMEEYRKTYEDLIRHVIVDHGVKDTFFMAGLKGNLDSETRLRCYMNVLAQNRMDFNYDMVGYGDFWDDSTKRVMENLLKDGKKPPRAIFCANDIMAMTVCDFLKERGYKVPDDVIVTGFDGIDELEFFEPRITTCKENVPGVCKMAAALVKGAIAGTYRPGTYTEQYETIYGESCGCKGPELDSSFRERSAMLMKRLRDMQKHEKHVNTGIDKFLATDDIDRIKTIFRTYTMLPNSYICFKNDLLEAFRGNILTTEIKEEFDKLTVFSSETGDAAISDFTAKDLIPDIEEWLADDTMCVINTLFIESFVCGFYVLKTDNIELDAHKLNRLSLSLNLAMSVTYGRIKQKEMLANLADTAYIEPISKLANLSGLEKWFSEFAAKEENENKKIALCIFKVAKIQYIYENFGVEAIRDMVVSVSTIVKSNAPEHSFMAHIGDDEFIVLSFESDNDEEAKEEIVRKYKNAILSAVENLNVSGVKEYPVEINYGYTVSQAGKDCSLRSLMKIAYGELYLNKMDEYDIKASSDISDTEIVEAIENYYDDLNLILKRGLLEYHFQPIVDTNTEEIYGYEALMRSTGGIVLVPETILAVAEKYNRLYEVEKLTLFGIMDHYVENIEKFYGKKLFINSIPGHFLKDDDYTEFVEKYSPYFKNCVFEITEQDQVSDEELERMRKMFKGKSGGALAVDDYGAGHSNIANLLKYSPNVIKIDRFLIEDIENDKNKQLFVSNVVEFGKLNKIKIVGEGVETGEELATVIKLGVDYIQGFFTARPMPDPIEKLPADKRRYIRDCRSN